MKRSVIRAAIIILLIIAAAAYVLLALPSEEAYDRTNAQFLKKFGWEVKLPAEEYAHITIPAEFDDVYLNYNSLQLKAGFDLLPYRGCDAARYTYIVKNLPEAMGEVRANILCVGGKPIGGDIMSTALDGFMHPLNWHTDV